MNKYQILQNVIALFLNIKFKKVIGFGDSMTDTGRLFEITKFFNSIDKKVAITPSSPPQNNGRFTNDLVFFEYLSQKLDIDPSTPEFSNQALAAAQSKHVGIPQMDKLGIYGDIFKLEQMVDEQLAVDMFDFSKEDNLYQFAIGNNDYWDLINETEFNQDIVNETVEEIIRNVEKIRYSGGKQFIIQGNANGGLSPWIANNGEDCSQNISRQNKAHNMKLDEIIKKQEKQQPEVQIMFIDLWEINNDSQFSGEFDQKYLSQPCVMCGEIEDFNNVPKFSRSDFDDLESKELKECKIPVENKQIDSTSIDSMNDLGNGVVNYMFKNLGFISEENDGENLDADISGCKVCEDAATDHGFFDFAHPNSVMHQRIADETYRKMVENKWIDMELDS